jgi:propionate CoA-transferase
MYQKVMTAAEAVSGIPDEAVVGVCGVNYAGTPLELIDALARRFETERHPKSITLINAGNNGGVHRLAIHGLVGNYIAGFPTLDLFEPGPGFLDGDKIPVFSLTQGIASQFYASQAAGVPYLMKPLPGTYLDPAHGGGCANKKARESAKSHPMVSHAMIGGKTWLHIDMPKVTVVLLRATSADRYGNLADDDESVKGELLPMAMAAHNNGGLVVAQVNTLLEHGKTDAANVKVPGMLVDRVVVCTDPVKWAPQNLTGIFHPGMTGRFNVARETIPFDEWKPEGAKRIMARRGAAELWPGCIVNFGLGIPMGVPYVLSEAGLQDQYYPTVELGAVGGHTSGGLYFSGAFNPRAFLRHDDMFTFINGGGLDITFLGAAEIGADGSVNVTRIAGKTNGSGGFMNISSNTHKIVFMCAHTAGGKTETRDGKLTVVAPGKPLKFVPKVEQTAFNGQEAAKKGQDVTYITERAVFRLLNGKVTLTEVAPGIDVETDVIGAMGFRPELSGTLKAIPDSCFRDEPVGLPGWK